jgi:hypothetical protein
MMDITANDINKHGRLIFVNKLGYQVTLYGYIREVNGKTIIWQDNEHSDKFKIKTHTIKSFKRIML